MDRPLPASHWLLPAILTLATARFAVAQELPPPPRPADVESLPDLLGEDVEGVDLPPEREATTGASLDDPSFEPRYVLERIVVLGNRKTRQKRILREIGLGPGDIVAATDDRVLAARARLLSLGYFLDVRLSLEKGRTRGRAVLTVQVVERGTIVIEDVFLGSSKATDAWGGLGVAENNFLGGGVKLQGAFVASTRPEVAEAEPALAVAARFVGPASQAFGLSLRASVLGSRGSEFFRTSGANSDADPALHVATTTRRLGGTLGVSGELTPTTRLGVDARFEHLEAAWPGTRERSLSDGTSRSIDFGIIEGASQLATVALTLDHDGRSHPILPRRGRRALLSLQIGGPFLGSDYAFSKTVVEVSQYFAVGSNQSLSVHVFAGAIFGQAPYFDRFFVGDMNILLPQRALGQNFSTQPSYNFLDTGVAGHRYDNYAARAMVQYAVPLWRKRGFFYGGDAFVGVGLFGISSDHVFPEDEVVPIDLTGDLGVRLDTQIGVVNVSVANALGRLPL